MAPTRLSVRNEKHRPWGEPPSFQYVLGSEDLVLRVSGFGCCKASRCPASAHGILDTPLAVCKIV